ncbi:MAG: sensor histidine kinase [Candidatus Bathyarchaeota archaeon]|nr:sensor histidine kinase [Candidatus Bathyarchaeota archaeon]
MVIEIEMDDGEGIRPNDLEHIFERFYTGTGGKSGLGLSIAKSIIKAHKGDIKAYNRLEGGAVFEIWLG